MHDTTEGRSLRRWFTVAVVLLLLAAATVILLPLRGALGWAVILAFLLQPLQQSLTRRLGDRPDAAAWLVTLLVPFLILVPLALLGVAFAGQVGALVGSLQADPTSWNIDALQDPAQHPEVARLAQRLQSDFGISLKELHQYVVGSLETVARTVAAASGQMVVGAAGGLLEFFLMLFILFFMLRDGPAWLDRVVRLLPLVAAQREALVERTARVTRAVVYGCGVTAGLQGLLVGLGFAATGLSGPVVFGVLAGVVALLPFGGAAFVWAPAAVWLFVDDRVGAAVFMLAWGGFLSTADNFIRPMLISSQAPVSTLLVFLGVIGGVAAFGLIGFIVGPVVLVLATELLRHAEGSLAPPP
ncbi:MAG: hypothetical protein RL026_1525 [Pseudomonadota bacterium]|jgi:predicted PurR-regulated permease PerM